MNKKIAAVLKEQELLQKKQDYWIVNRKTGIVLNALVKNRKPNRILEIGTSIGYSTIWMAEALSKSGKIVTIDKWHERIEMARNFFKKAGLKNINAIEGDALKIIPKFGRQKFDFVFIDAMKREYLAYVMAASKKLKKHALIVADNTVSHAGKMKDFLDYASKKKGVTLDFEDGITLFEN